MSRTTYGEMVTTINRTADIIEQIDPFGYYPETQRAYGIARYLWETTSDGTTQDPPQTEFIPMLLEKARVALKELGRLVGTKKPIREGSNATALIGIRG
jgi:hypothetical protein